MERQETSRFNAHTQLLLMPTVISSSLTVGIIESWDQDQTVFDVWLDALVVAAQQLINSIAQPASVSIA